MSGSINKHIIIGRLGQDPKSRPTSTGGQVVTFSVATSHTWKDRDTGEKKENTQWHQVVIFNEPLGKIALEYLKKGSNVYLEGEVQTRSWETDGQKNYRTETVLNNFRGALTLLDRAERAPAPDENSYSKSSRPPPDLDDEIPF
jgi:single-strand DNA-binding protein